MLCHPPPHSSMPSPTTRLTRSQTSTSAKQTRSNYRSSICEECGEVVGSNRQEVEEHRQQIHGTGKYRCEEAFCSVGFKTVSLLRRHRLLKHQGRSSLGTPTKGKPTKVNGSKAEIAHQTNKTSSSLPGAPVIPLAKSSSSTVESTKAMSPVSADPPPTPTTPTITLSRIPKHCRIVPNTGPTLRFSGAIRKPTEDPSVRVMRPRGGVALPRYCPRCGIFLLLTGREFREHEQEHEINGLRSAIQLTWLEVSKKKSMAGPSEGGQGQGQVPHATTTSSNISPVNLTPKRQQVITKLTQSATVEVSASNGQGHLLQDSSKSSSSSLKINVAPAAESPSSAVISGSQPIRQPTPTSASPEVITIDDDDESGQIVATINNKRRRLLVASEADQKVTNQHKKRRCTVCNLETVCKKKMQHHIWWSHSGFNYAQIVIRVDVNQELNQEMSKSKPTMSTTAASHSALNSTETEVIELD